MGRNWSKCFRAGESTLLTFDDVKPDISLRAAASLCVTIRLDESFVAWSAPLYRYVVGHHRGGALQSSGQAGERGGVARLDGPRRHGNARLPP